VIYVQHIKALAIKLIALFVLIYVILGLFFNYSIGNVLTLTLLIGIVSYILGDLLLLPRTNNLTATISDFATAMILTWFYLATITYNENNLFLVSVILSIGVAIINWFFHKYMITNVIREKEPYLQTNNFRYQTEASEEISPDKSKWKKDNP
jgi:Zn-dependent protease with chaperone function